MVLGWISEQVGRVWSPGLRGLGLAAVFVLAACNTPSTVCDDYWEAAQDLLRRCGFSPSRCILVTDDGHQFTCQEADRVRDVAAIYDECIPNLEITVCERIADDPCWQPMACNDQFEDTVR